MRKTPAMSEKERADSDNGSAKLEELAEPDRKDTPTRQLTGTILEFVAKESAKRERNEAPKRLRLRFSRNQLAAVAQYEEDDDDVWRSPTQVMDDYEGMEEDFPEIDVRHGVEIILSATGCKESREKHAESSDTEEKETLEKRGEEQIKSDFVTQLVTSLAAQIGRDNLQLEMIIRLWRGDCSRARELHHGVQIVVRPCEAGKLQKESSSSAEPLARQSSRGYSPTEGSPEKKVTFFQEEEIDTERDVEKKEAASAADLDGNNFGSKHETIEVVGWCSGSDELNHFKCRRLNNGVEEGTEGRFDSSGESGEESTEETQESVDEVSYEESGTDVTLDLSISIPGSDASSQTIETDTSFQSNESVLDSEEMDEASGASDASLLQSSNESVLDSQEDMDELSGASDASFSGQDTTSFDTTGTSEMDPWAWERNTDTETEGYGGETDTEDGTAEPDLMARNLTEQSFGSNGEFGEEPIGEIQELEDEVFYEESGTDVTLDSAVSILDSYASSETVETDTSFQPNQSVLDVVVMESDAVDGTVEDDPVVTDSPGIETLIARNLDEAESSVTETLDTVAVALGKVHQAECSLGEDTTDDISSFVRSNQEREQKKHHFYFEVNSTAAIIFGSVLGRREKSVQINHRKPESKRRAEPSGVTEHAELVSPKEGSRAHVLEKSPVHRCIVEDQACTERSDSYPVLSISRKDLSQDHQRAEIQKVGSASKTDEESDRNENGVKDESFVLEKSSPHRCMVQDLACNERSDSYPVLSISQKDLGQDHRRAEIQIVGSGPLMSDEQTEKTEEEWRRDEIQDASAHVLGKSPAHRCMVEDLKCDERSDSYQVLSISRKDLDQDHQLVGIQIFGASVNDEKAEKTQGESEQGENELKDASAMTDEPVVVVAAARKNLVQDHQLADIAETQFVVSTLLSDEEAETIEEKESERGESDFKDTDIQSGNQNIAKVQIRMDTETEMEETQKGESEETVPSWSESSEFVDHDPMTPVDNRMRPDTAGLTDSCVSEIMRKVVQPLLEQDKASVTSEKSEVSDMSYEISRTGKFATTETESLQSIPSQILTEPQQKFIFNAPFSTQSTYILRMTNKGPGKIGWALKTNQPRRFMISLGSGILEVEKSVDVHVTCDAFNYYEEKTEADRISLEWTTLPEGFAQSHVSSQAFQHMELTQRKNLPVFYNP